MIGLRAAGLAAIGLTLSACVNAPRSPIEASRSEAYANFLVGRMADLRADHASALDHYYSALQRTPSDPALIDGAMTAALAAGEVDRAREIARLAQAHNVVTPQVNLLRAADALVAGRYRQARTQLNAVRGGAPEELTKRMMLIWTRAGEGKIEEATAELGGTDLARPYSGLVAYQRALAFDYSGDEAQARAAYEQAENGGLWSPPAIERYADMLVREGERDAALDMLRARDARGYNPAIADVIARIEADLRPARERLTPARGGAIGLYSLASIFMQEAGSAEALSVLTLALVLDPDLDAARIAFAEAQIELGHADLARASLARIPSASPYASTAQTMEAMVLLREGRDAQAIAVAQENAETGGLRAKRALAELYRGLERYGDAEPIYSELIAADPSDWRLHFARGVARERLRRWDEAEGDLRRALELSPEQPEVLNYLGYTWVDRGEHLEEALRMIQRAVELRPLSGAIVDSLGWAHFKLGDYEQAVTHLERAVELEPADALLNDHLGDAYWRAGRRIEARFQWQRALSLDPAGPDANAIQVKLDDGMPPLPRTRSATR